MRPLSRAERILLGIILAAIAAWSVLLVVSHLVLPAHGAVMCQERPDPGRGVAWWRMVDGRKCWYRGTGRLDKSQLRWPRQEAQPEPPSTPGPPPASFRQRFPDASDVEPRFWQDRAPTTYWYDTLGGGVW